eukprot:TRINITY_DN14840_c0_g1_i2.p2 TRINITY_DN14840_c0_g1~~TRINITY_DN14840_c0_g1_i2.p2  ORF type:complete len:138 (-),score=4.71 TRINITY_DN14840_c0_g1_i2:5-418(-)
MLSKRSAQCAVRRSPLPSLSGSKPQQAALTALVRREGGSVLLGERGGTSPAGMRCLMLWATARMSLYRAVTVARALLVPGWSEWPRRGRPRAPSAGGARALGGEQSAAWARAAWRWLGAGAGAGCTWIWWTIKYRKL